MLVKNHLVVRLKTTTGRKKRRIRSWRLTRLRAEPHRRSHYPVSFREHKSCCSDGCWMQLTIAILMDFLSLVLSWVDCVTWNFSIVIKVAAWNCLNRWNVEIILLCAIYSSRLCWWGRSWYTLPFCLDSQCIAVSAILGNLFWRYFRGLFITLNETARHNVTTFCGKATVSIVSINLAPIWQYANLLKHIR